MHVAHALVAGKGKRRARKRTSSWDPTGHTSAACCLRESTNQRLGF